MAKLLRGCAIILPFLTGTSAAQNVPVIRICSKCGALLMDDAEPCSFCENPAQNSDMLQPVASGRVVEERSRPSGHGFNRAVNRVQLGGALAPEGTVSNPSTPSDDASNDDEPEWRVEVTRRLEQYRARRRGAVPDENQSPLPFRESAQPRRRAAPQIEIAQHVELAPAPKPRPRPIPRQRVSERMEICIQPELDFSPAPGERARPQTALVPVATLAARRNAGILDGFFVLLTSAAFSGLFAGLIRSMGGNIIVDRMDALMSVPVIFLFYALYFLVFTFFAGVTPGMQLCGLTVVRLDGRLPDSAQLLWRAFGYVLSAATLMMGFAWALWDEDKFTWQDRISQTYITSSAPLADPDPIQFTTPRRR